MAAEPPTEASGASPLNAEGVPASICEQLQIQADTYAQYWQATAGYSDAPFGYSRTDSYSFEGICPDGKAYGYHVPTGGNQHSLLELGCY